jgi:hypothetical protein
VQRNKIQGAGNMALPEKRSSISYAAFMELGEDVQYEVINGQVYNMSPHQV